MSLADVVRILRAYWRSILAVTLLAGAVGTALLFLQKPTYTSQATLYLLPRAEGAAGQLAAAQELAQAQARQFADLAAGPVVLEPVHKKLGLPGESTSLVGRVRAAVPANTTSIVVSTSDASPEFAHDVVEATSEQLLTTIKDFSPDGAESVLEARITSPASLPSRPDGPNVMQHVGAAVAIGLALGVGLALLREYFNDSVTDEDAVARVTDHRVLGEVPFVKDGKQAKAGGFSVQGEAYRRLRTNLQFLMLADGAKSILVTSSIPGEGKTRTSASLAKALADAGSRVLLVDGDMRRPQLAEVHEVEEVPGLSSALLHRTPISTLVQRVDEVDLLTAGIIPPNPSELLGSEAMKRLLQEAAEAYDVVIIDTPPVLPVTDSTALSQSVDGVIVVADTTSLRRRALASALKRLDSVHANVYGVVLNKLPLRSGGYGSGYGYGYGYYDSAAGQGRRQKKSGRRRARGQGGPRRGARG